MTKQLHIGRRILASAATLVLLSFGTSVSIAQSPQNNPNRPPKAQSAPAPKPQSSNRPPANQRNRPPSNQAPAAQTNRPPTNSTNVQRDGRPPNAGVNPNHFAGSSNGSDPDARMKPRQEIGAGAPRPFVDKLRDLSPTDRSRVLQSSKAFKNLPSDKQNRIREQFNQWDKMSPQQRADLRSKEDTWRRMTPEQRDHVKNEVLPKWRQIPFERRQVIQQRLGVLQNMPESARNQRLNDPNFTRGMSEDDKATLRDLSHLHVGGAPDPPPAQ